MSTFVNVQGSFKPVQQMYTRVSGSLVPIKNAWTKKDNVWQRVYRRNQWWYQLGLDLTASTDSKFGRSVAMNATGDRMVVGGIQNDTTSPGFARAYSWNGTSWVPLGGAFTGNGAPGDLFGYSVSMNAVGDRVAIGSHGSNVSGVSDCGQVRVYSWNGSSWSQLGGNIDGAFAQDQLGYSVSLNAVGDKIAIGAIGSDVAFVDGGGVGIYSLVGSTWTQTATIIGLAASQYSGFSVSMNAAGDRVAIGSPYFTSGGALGGIVQTLSSSNGINWTVYGSTILAPPGDYSGYSVSLNGVGNRIAIGAPYNNNASGTDAGCARMYSLSGVTWTQMGTDILGQAAYDLCGLSVSMNYLGDIVAVGSPTANQNLTFDTADDAGRTTLYFWNGSSWVRLGQDINGEGAYDNSGYSVSLHSYATLSADTGVRVAIGAPLNDDGGNQSGHVRVYSLNQWQQLGSDIEGEASYDYSGYSVYMNSLGTRLAIGANNNDGTGGKVNCGHVRVYQWSTSWTQLGQDLDGDANADLFGSSVSMNSVGNVIAIGAPEYNGTAGVNSGRVKLYSLNVSTWVQIGSPIEGQTANEYTGSSLSVDSTGYIVAVGAPRYAGAGTNSGRARVFSWDGLAWNQLGTIPDGASGDQLGYKVSLNANGTLLAVGAPYGGAGDEGYVKIYSWSGSAWTQVGQTITGAEASGNLGSSLSFNETGDKIAIGVPYGGGSSKGKAKMYYLNGSTWTQMGTDINGQMPGENLGSSISFNAVGDRVLIGSPDNTGSFGLTNTARVYYWNGSMWNQLGPAITGRATNDQNGFSVSINAEGDRIAVSAIQSNNSTNTKLGCGHVRVLAV